ncbi:MAG: hypothetical protein R6U17_00060 [Thermoplasmata archaeon]
MINLEIVAAAWITVFALALLTVSLLSYRVNGNHRILVIALAFLVFLVKGVLMSLHILTESRLLVDHMTLLDLTVLLLLAGAVLLKGRVEDE